MPKMEVPLTARQVQIVRLVMAGHKYKDIATQLDLSYESVKTYVVRIREKLGLATKVDLAVWGMQHLGEQHGRAKPRVRS